MFSLFLVFAHRYSHLAMKISSINKLEGDIKIIKNEADKDSNENTLYIKDRNNIFLYLNGTKKKHDPIKINLNDDV